MNVPNINEVNENLKKFCIPRYVKNKYPEFYDFIINRYTNCSKFTERLWLYFHNEHEKPKCPVCGSPLKFNNWTEGYLQYCSRRCMSKSTRSKANNTMIEKYGGVGWASNETREKIKKTTNERYGGVGLASEVLRKKFSKTMIEKYGVEIPLKSKAIAEKQENTMKVRYGVRRALQSPEFLEKSKNTLNIHYGVDYPAESREILSKMIETHHTKYGGVGMESEEIKSKIIETNMKKYGREYGFDYDKIRETNLELYGDENPLIARCMRGEIKYHGYSPISQKFFNELDIFLSQRYTTQYASKGGEKLFKFNGKNYYADYFIEELSTAIEFNGDVWHANPNIYQAGDRCFPMNKNITAQDIWCKDREKINNLETNGIRVLVVWESEYNKGFDIKKWLIQNNIIYE